MKAVKKNPRAGLGKMAVECPKCTRMLSAAQRDNLVKTGRAVCDCDASIRVSVGPREGDFTLTVKDLKRREQVTGVGKTGFGGMMVDYAHRLWTTVYHVETEMPYRPMSSFGIRLSYELSRSA